MTMEKELVDRVDRAARKLKTTRSGFTRQVLRNALDDLTKKRLVAKYKAGYAQHPVEPGEFDVWEDEQVWGDE
jgi:metal-responsive CopG/Arc/MetJ family transcriptional regulator